MSEIAYKHRAVYLDFKNFNIKKIDTFILRTWEATKGKRL